MIKCPICQCNNPDYNNYCISCGYPLKQNITNNNIENYTITKTKSVLLSIFLSFIGLGYLYLEQWANAVLFYIMFPILYFYLCFFFYMIVDLDLYYAYLAAYFLIVIVFFMYFYQIYDTYKIAININAGKITFNRK